MPDDRQSEGGRGALGFRRRVQGRPAAFGVARERRQGAAIQPDHAALCGRGNDLIRLRRYAEALATYDQAIAIKSDYADAFNNRGVSLLGLNRLLQALASYDKALAAKPGHAEALYNRGNLLRQLKRPLEALASYDQAIAIRPDYADAFNNRGNALQGLQRPLEALASYDRAVAIRPTFVESHENKGILLAELGQLAAAREALQTAITLAPRRTRSHFYLALLKQTRAGDPHLAIMEDMALDIDSLTASEQIDLNFALAKAYEDCGDYERSFRSLASGNALKRKRVVYHEDAALRVFKRLVKAFTRRDAPASRCWRPLRRAGVHFWDAALGMTVVEQILTSHPRVHAAGEIDDFENAINGLRERCRSLPTNCCEVSARVTCKVSGPLPRRPIGFWTRGQPISSMPASSISRCQRRE